ncbi:MAG: hypothetical protein RL308_1745 [Bacteroidota bacterium]|jgi:hypothetical protein
MKCIKHFFALTFLLPSFLLAQTKANISIENKSNLDFKETVVSVKWEAIVSKYPQIDTTAFVVINDKTKKQIPFQLEHLGLKAIQNLLLQVDVKANSSISLTVQKGKPENVVVKTYGRYVPERKDDFAWENDNIAFRAYGKALEKTKEDAYGLDVWVKRTNKMVLNERYKLGDYHIDHSNGLDYYHVGFSLGAGNMAPYVNDTIRYSGNYHQWKVLDNGPLRTTFQLIFDTWNAGGIKVKATKTISLDAGSQLNRIENNYSFDGEKAMPVVVGIIKRPETGILTLNEKQGMMAYWEPTHVEHGTTAIGVLLTTPVNTMLVNEKQILAKTMVKNNVPIIYYAGAVWDKAGKIANSNQWNSYLENFQKGIQSPLIINLK